MHHKKTKRSLSFLLVIILLVSLSGCGKSESDTSQSKQENYHTKIVDGQEYKVFDKAYEGQYIYVKGQCFSNYNNISEDFEGVFVKTYPELCYYCEQFELDVPYNDHNKKYIVASDFEAHGYASNCLVDVKYDGNKATMYYTEAINENTYNPDWYTLIIPVDENIEEVILEKVYTEKELAGDYKSDAYIDPYWDEPAVDKPVIYLYPEEQTKVDVKLDIKGELTCTYPFYDNGWSIIANPDGTLVDSENMEYNYLYWEGKMDVDFDFSKGFCVRGEDTAKFLEKALNELGLTRAEANEFIVYWLPKMECNEYNVISFQEDLYTDNAKLDIKPAPDTLIRVFMAYYPSEDYVDIEEQIFTTPARDGFVAVEWGGTEITK